MTIDGSHEHEDIEALRLQLKELKSRVFNLEMTDHSHPAPEPVPEHEHDPEPTPEPEPVGEQQVFRDEYYGDVAMISGDGNVDSNRVPTNPWKLKVGSVTLIAAKSDANPRPGYILTGGSTANGQVQDRGKIDPIVNPGSVSHHDHRFVGLPESTPNEVVARLTTGDVLDIGTLPSKIVSWMPSADVGILGNTGYVENRHGFECVFFPQGLRYITDKFYWKEQNNSHMIVLTGPTWSDGRLDSPDHRSHVSFEKTETHTIPIPEYRHHWRFDAPYSGPKPILSAPSPHMDVWFGDDPRLGKALADHVLNKGRTMGRMTEHHAM